jgi:hypothetical protein
MPYIYPYHYFLHRKKLDHQKMIKVKEELVKI